MPDPQRLSRLHRVRTLQLTLAQADEARAHDHHASEATLHTRIARLAEGVALSQTEQAGIAFGAAAHYRDRLHQSAIAAEARMQVAEQSVARAVEARREARRDQNAIEKLMERAQADAVLKALRALEAAPAGRTVRRES